MNLEEILKKPFNELTKEEVEFVYDNINWEQLYSKYVEQQKELERLAKNN